ncbi:unnamed protein product [Meloidogyne enterolobii]|uniref:Uncharacterized protein n=1 Tax=Meloidogyne enterolobii TaxID=390850 RepID=A0ACB1B9V0_MELEN
MKKWNQKLPTLNFIDSKNREYINAVSKFYRNSKNLFNRPEQREMSFLGRQTKVQVNKNIFVLFYYAFMRNNCLKNSAIFILPYKFYRFPFWEFSPSLFIRERFLLYFIFFPIPPEILSSNFYPFLN